MRVESFIEALATMHLKDVFNPYTDRCEIYDKPNAPALRRTNLSEFLIAASIRPVDSIWIARDLGYRGGRRTGLPLTDEVHLPTFSQVFGGLKLHRATIGPPVAERTAAIVWRMLMCISVPVFLWNVFPFHPYLPGEPLSNRCHSARERRASESFLTTSTVSEQSFLYIQWCQEVMLFPMIQASTLIALQTPGLFMPPT
jgi:hypothetical protein